jgi:two-component system cell cycle response regulator DivK
MKPTVLYIEDHPDNMMLVRRILRKDSYTLLEARSGLMGLSIAESQDLDLILLDINLPDMDGYKVARRLRQSSRAALAHTPIVAITANALKGDAEKALQSGCNHYMTKPINIQDFIEMVESLTHSQQEEIFHDI